MTTEEKSKKTSSKGSTIKASFPNETIFDEETEIALLKLVSGSSVSSLALELKEAKLSSEQKASVCRLSVCAAIAARRALQITLPADFSQVLAIPMFVLNNQLNYTKLVIIGHVLMRYPLSGAVGEAWRNKIKGALSIFETEDLSMFPEKRMTIIRVLKMKASFTKESGETLYAAVVPSKP
jgi:hypothetical protein